MGGCLGRRVGRDCSGARSGESFADFGGRVAPGFSVENDQGHGGRVRFARCRDLFVVGAVETRGAADGDCRA